MNHPEFRMFLVVLALCVASPVGAAEASAGPWSGKVAMGYLAVSGNTESTTFSGDVEINWDGERWHHQLLGKALGKSEDKQTTAEAYKTSYQGKFDLSERTYLFGLLDFNKDRFSSYDHQLFETLGLGQRILKTDRHELNLELGAGASQSRLIEDLPGGGTLETDVNEATFRVSSDYKWSISDNAELRQKLSVTSGSNNTYTESVTELSAGIIGSLSTVLGYIVKHNSDVTVGKDKTDTFTAISLEYTF